MSNWIARNMLSPWGPLIVFIIPLAFLGVFVAKGTTYSSPVTVAQQVTAPIVAVSREGGTSEILTRRGRVMRLSGFCAPHQRQLFGLVATGDRVRLATEHVTESQTFRPAKTLAIYCVVQVIPPAALPVA